MLLLSWFLWGPGRPFCCLLSSTLWLGTWGLFWTWGLTGKRGDLLGVWGLFWTFGEECVWVVGALRVWKERRLGLGSGSIFSINSITFTTRMVKHSFFSASRTFSFGRKYTSRLLCPNFQSKLVAKPGLGHSPQRQWILSYYNNFLIEDSPDPQLPDFVASHPFSNPIGSSLFDNFLCNIVVLKGDPRLIPTNPISRDLGIVSHHDPVFIWTDLRKLDWVSGPPSKQAAGTHSVSGNAWISCGT